MIGGSDIVIRQSRKLNSFRLRRIHGALNRAAQRIVLGVLDGAWPDALLEDADGKAPPRRVRDLHRAALPSEFFVYRDASSLASWRADGATAENVDAMLHVIAGDGTFTCVVDDHAGAQTAHLARAIERALSEGPKQRRKASR